MNVVLVAAEAAGLQALKLLAASEHRVVAVLTSTEDEARGVTVAAQARRLGVHVWPARLVTDPAFAERIADAEVDLVLNIHSLLVIDGRVLGAPRIGSFNLHPGPLPQYAGLSVPSWAIYHGERRHGVTLHWMEPEVDAGAVVSEASFAIGPCDTGLTVSAACVRHGLPLVAGLLEVAARDPSAIPATEQDLSRRRWFGRRGPHGGRVPWTLSGRDWLTSSARRTTRPGPLLGATPGLGSETSRLRWSGLRGRGNRPAHPQAPSARPSSTVRGWRRATSGSSSSACLWKGRRSTRAKSSFRASASRALGTHRFRIRRLRVRCLLRLALSLTSGLTAGS
ncbi:MAG TPA: formyltransferase family protein [Thermoleophilaceae bacterium]|jgi:UDP-4-amino-4-deoxy-L-arabinose formyltransferase/UDP-glucuronic acid dehydrogenase (UDP-4-keto-hexauronic acid decarboxylating)|nr:formyltransferase family protein [Thermoleophilaceae bacterium]